MLQKIRRSKLGFTIIELMIVIAIVAIVLATVIPLIVAHRESYTEDSQQVEETTQPKETTNEDKL